MKDFFVFETELPAGSGFELFGMCHVLWLLGILIFTVISGGWYVEPYPGKLQSQETGYL